LWFFYFLTFFYSIIIKKIIHYCNFFKIALLFVTIFFLFFLSPFFDVLIQMVFCIPFPLKTNTLKEDIQMKEIEYPVFWFLSQA